MIDRAAAAARANADLVDALTKQAADLRELVRLFYQETADVRSAGVRMQADDDGEGQPDGA